MNDSDHRVQGLDNDDVAADWPAISPAEIAWLQTRYAALEGACRVLWRSPRPFSAAALVEARHGRVFVKRHHTAVRTAAQLGEEHAFIAHLAAAGIPTAMLFVRNPSGISHAPAEDADEADCLAGIDALTATLERLLS